jgi:NADH:ubiquinone reductase (H+-translocating)
MKKKIIVVGGGFAGLQFIKHLKKGSFDVMLIDRLNHHQFQPLFYQVATSQIEPTSISFPFRKIFQNRKDISVRLAEVLSVDPENNTILTTAGSFSYDYLVIATGARTNFFGNGEIMKNALSLKTTYEAITIRNRILENFENILNSGDTPEESMFNIIIVGGGPTGVELSGAFAEIRRDILPKDYPGIDISRIKVILLEGGPHTLNTMSDMAKKKSEKYLNDMGVILKTGVFVRNYDGDKLTLSNGENMRSRHVIWAAGITGNLIKGLSPEVITAANRIKVNRMNMAQGYKNIYAIGDIAFMETPGYPAGHPQVANVAINQGKNLARNLRSLQTGGRQTEFEYKDLGSMATVGRNKAVVDLPFIRFGGYFAWYVWMFLHLMLILSVRNKLIVFINWAWNYFTKNSSLRLILKVQENNNSQ